MSRQGSDRRLKVAETAFAAMHRMFSRLVAASVLGLYGQRSHTPQHAMRTLMQPNCAGIWAQTFETTCACMHRARLTCDPFLMQRGCFMHAVC